MAAEHTGSASCTTRRGNVEQALTHYTQFVDLWKNADADMQPRMQNVRDRIRELQRRRG